MALCWYCGKVKGKRVCPARGGELICSRCCGTKRRVEIRCPEDCVYLHGADANWTSEARQKEDARFLSHFLRLEERAVAFAVFIHHLVLQAARPLRALGEGDLVVVLEAATSTLETRAKGVLYSHQTQAPHLQPLADWLARTLSERGDIAAAPEASDEDVVAALHAVVAAAKDHASRGPERDRYFDVAERVLRESLSNAPAVELPDELSSSSGKDLIVPP